jgi:hypothetical protein
MMEITLKTAMNPLQQQWTARAVSCRYLTPHTAHPGKRREKKTRKFRVTLEVTATTPAAVKNTQERITVETPVFRREECLGSMNGLTPVCDKG